MLHYRLVPQELAELLAAHRAARDVREAYRINAVILLGKGGTPADVADALPIDPDTARDYFKRYTKGGRDGLLRMSDMGSGALLDATQLAELEANLQRRLHLAAESAARWVEQRRGSVTPRAA